MAEKQVGPSDTGTSKNRIFCQFSAVFGPKLGRISTDRASFRNMRAWSWPDGLKISAGMIYGARTSWSVADRHERC